MKSRLAFSIASLVQPDILILDEVLSVGDGAFRQKSEAKMREIINGGATTILVSHSIRQVRSMCSKILWLHKGKQIAFGDDVPLLCDAYEEFLHSGRVPQSRQEIGRMAAEYRGRTIPELKVSLNADGKPRLVWNRIEGAEKYVIFRAEGESGKFEKIFTTIHTTFTNLSAVSGETYTYKVCTLTGERRGRPSDARTVVSE